MVRRQGRAVRVMVILIIVALMSTVNTESRTYARTASSFPSDVSLSFLMELMVGQCKQSHPCLHQCNLQPDCRLVCIKGSKNSCSLFADSTCHMYRRLVGEQRAGYSKADALDLESCFTSSTHSRQIFPAATSQSGDFRDCYSSEAVSGYLTTSARFCSVTAREASPWWWADLGESKTVSEIVVHVRRDGYSDSHFRSVVARLGDALDRAQNPLFDSKDGAPESGSIVKFTSARPRKGRYLSLQSIVSAGHLTICDIQILS